MISADTFTYPGADGIHEIFARKWLPEGAPRAVVQIAHGVSEHSGRYDGFARFLAGHGFAVYAQDHLGHGYTAGESDRGWFAEKDGWQLVTRDVCDLRRLAGEQWPGIPYFLLGHSMGSFLTRTYLIDYPGTVDGAILSGTGQEGAALVAAGRLLSSMICAACGTKHVSALVQYLSMGAYNKKFRPNRTPCDWINRDPAQVDAYLADPLCGRTATVGLFRDMLGGITYIGNRKNLARMDRDTPVYFFSGDQDPVGAMGAGVRKTAGLFRDAGCRDVEVKLYPGGRHEMLNDPERDTVYADVLAWLEKRL